MLLPQKWTRLPIHNPHHLNDFLCLYINNLPLRHITTQSLAVTQSSGVRPQMVIRIGLTRRVAVRHCVPPGAAAGAPPEAGQLGGDLAAALECLREGHSELPVEVCVDERVQGGVEIAHPEDEGDQPRRVVALVA